MKIVFVSSMLPSGHFSQYLTSGLAQAKDVELIVYTDQNPKNLHIKGCGQIKLVWSKSPKFIWEIWQQALRDKPDVIHLQQELNMYGGPLTAIIFPWLVLLLRLSAFKVVTTIHAAVYKSQIDDDFVRTFHKNPQTFKPLFLTWLFQYLYYFSHWFSHDIVLHNQLMKKILVSDYYLHPDKITVIKTAIPDKKVDNQHKQAYFFYFGHMVRRKGLDYLLKGFAQFLAKNPRQKFKLIMAGGVIPGQEVALQEVKDLIKQLKLTKQVLIKGYIEESDQDLLYQHAYAVVIPALYSMGSAGPLYHAFSYGKCVIATKIGHFLCDIKDHKTGLLTDNDKWAEAMTLAIKHPKLVQSIEQYVEVEKKRRTPSLIALKYVRLYQLE